MYWILIIVLDNVIQDFLEFEWLLVLSVTCSIYIIVFLSLCTLVNVNCHFCEFPLEILGCQWYWAKNSQAINVFSDLNLGALTLLDTNSTLIVHKKSVGFLGLTGIDVIHSFAAPTLGVKMDVLPGRIWTATVTFRKYGSCYCIWTELSCCFHSFMSFTFFVFRFNKR